MKLTGVALAVAALVVLSGCSDSGGGEASASGTSAETPAETIDAGPDLSPLSEEQWQAEMDSLAVFAPPGLDQVVLLACHAQSPSSATVQLTGTSVNAYPGYPAEMYLLTARRVCPESAAAMSDAVDAMADVLAGVHEACTTPLTDLIATGDRDLAALQQFCGRG